MFVSYYCIKLAIFTQTPEIIPSSDKMEAQESSGSTPEMESQQEVADFSETLDWPQQETHQEDYCVVTGDTYEDISSGWTAISGEVTEPTGHQEKLHELSKGTNGKEYDQDGYEDNHISWEERSDGVGELKQDVVSSEDIGEESPLSEAHTNGLVAVNGNKLHDGLVFSELNDQQEPYVDLAASTFPAEDQLVLPRTRPSVSVYQVEIDPNRTIDGENKMEECDVAGTSSDEITGESSPVTSETVVPLQKKISPHRSGIPVSRVPVFKGVFPVDF